ncbi:MAG: Uma2 family endonuclease [Tepidisphaeraceae bacterium]
MSVIASQPQTHRPSLRMTEDEFVRWADEENRAEWVDGEVTVKMSVEEVHDVLQRAIASAVEQLALKRKLGEVRGPEFTMRLPQRPSRREPDVLFVATENVGRLEKKKLEGPADLVLEIVSPESRHRDYREKFAEYQAAGVREYWIIDPGHQAVDAYRLDEKTREYVEIPADAEKRFCSVVLPGFWLRPTDLFTDPLPRALQLMKLLGVAD